MADRGRAPTRRTDRRDHILTAALELFNERGTASVTTNHIAERAGISPGNLYYWFPNKGSIVRALFERWSAESEVRPTAPGSAPARLRALLDAVRGQAGLTRRYGVVARELLPLLHDDEQLAELYRASFEHRVAAFEGAVDALVAAGLLRAPRPPLTVRDLVVASWILGESTPPFLAAVRRAADPAEESADASSISAALLLSHLTESGHAALAATDPEGPDEPDDA